ncbi:MAG: hypothetical protein K1W34_21480 [Lachnospiraceae bacterium]
MNSAILKGNGELWETYPEMKKVKNNVKNMLQIGFIKERAEGIPYL